MGKYLDFTKGGVRPKAEIVQQLREKIEALIMDIPKDMDEIAREIGVSPSGLYNFLKGHVPDRVRFIKYARFLDAKMEELEESKRKMKQYIEK